jgi:hypothetical protein
MTRVKSAIALPSGKTYLFSDAIYNRYDFVSGAADQIGSITAPSWRGLRILAADAAVYWGCGKVYFFYGDEYVRYDLGNDAVDPEYLPPNAPLKIFGHWPGLWTDRIDAAVNWGNGKIYVFRDSEYMRYDLTLDRVDAGYPKNTSTNWNGVWSDRVDAVLYHGGQKAYFFRDNLCRHYDLAQDRVDQENVVEIPGMLSVQVFDPAPSGLFTPARDLTLQQANQVMGYLIQDGRFGLRATQTPYLGDWLTGIASPAPSTHVVVQPAKINGVTFESGNATGAAIIDNVDQRMLIALYRLTRWLNASSSDVTTLRHMGIGHGSGPPTDCHNQGRALDLSGIEGSNFGTPFILNVQSDWGNLPMNPIGASAPRIDNAIKPLARELFRNAFCFGSLECESNGIGPTNKWPPKEIGDPGGFVCHPDYVNQPGGQDLRTPHQNHLHMQVGPT